MKLFDKILIFKRIRDCIKNLIKTKHLELTDIQYSDYFSTLKIDNGKSQRERAFEKAWEVRDFEIKLYWERAKYFWAFIASTFIAYFASLGDISKNFYQLQYIIICIGFVFSIAWWLVNISSKHWQENWEGHIDRLEDKYTGPLYKTVRNFSFNFSVSKINIIVSFFVSLIWLLFAAIYFKEHISFDKNLHVAWIEIISSLLVVLVCALFLCYGKSGSNKTKPKYYNRGVK